MSGAHEICLRSDFGVSASALDAVGDKKKKKKAFEKKLKFEQIASKQIFIVTSNLKQIGPHEKIVRLFFIFFSRWRFSSKKLFKMLREGLSVIKPSVIETFEASKNAHSRSVSKTAL